MAKKFDPSIDNISANLHDSYISLLSGNSSELDAVRPLIAAYRDSGVDIAALDLLDRLKKWIANADNAKKRAFLQKMHLDAMQYFGGPGLGTWRTMAYCARVFRYSGRFWKAQKAYNAAIALIGNFASHTESERKAIADIYVDFAEFRAYLGHPGEADNILSWFPPDYLMGWHEWVRATAYHFWGHEAAQPFASPGATNDPGPEDKYLDSNAFLAAARAKTEGKALPPKEAIDTYLLEAANWGAIWRRRLSHGGDVAQAQAGAADALAIFQGAGSDPVNSEWSWEKERRGRLAIFFRKKLDGALDRQDVEDWRRKFRNHYRENLVQAGVQLTSASADPALLDGQLDSEDDHGDDETD